MRRTRVRVAKVTPVTACVGASCDSAAVFIWVDPLLHQVASGMEDTWDSQVISFLQAMLVAPL